MRDYYTNLPPTNRENSMFISIFPNLILRSQRWYLEVGHATISCKNIGTNDKFCRKVALLRYTERLKFMSQSREIASKRKPYRGLGTR